MSGVRKTHKPVIIIKHAIFLLTAAQYIMKIKSKVDYTPDLVVSRFLKCMSLWKQNI